MAISRKSFLRVLGGGGIVVAAGAFAVSRLDAMPAVAIEAWRGPEPSEKDPRRRALAWALLAPNPHNLQSWAVDLAEPDAIVLYVDRTRLLPQTDPFSRQILIGHGCFLELLALAAAAGGHRTETTLFPDGEWTLDKPVARISFAPQPGVAPDPLFAQAARRRTVKSAFESRPLEPAHRTALLAVAGLGLTFDIAERADKVDRLRTLAIAGSELEMKLPRTHKESIDVARIGATEIAMHRDGISLKGPMIWALRQTGQMTPEKAMTEGTMAWNGGRDYALAGYASAQAFGWIASAANGRATQVGVGRAFLRFHLKATELGVALQPHSQTLQEYPEMADLRVAIKRETGIAPDHTLQMFFRLGYAGDPGPSPRRALTSFIRS